MRLSIVLGAVVLSSLLLATDLMAQAPPGGRGGGMMPPDPFRQTIDALGDLNLRPDFTLSSDQKEKLQAIRDEVKKAEDKWRADNATQLKQLQDDMQAARDDQDMDKAREIRGKLRDLMQTMPKNDAAVTQVKALLSADQVKALDTRITQRQEEMRARMPGMGPMGGGRGGRGGESAPPPPPPAGGGGGGQ